MSVSLVRAVLLWSALSPYRVLIAWFAAYVAARGLLHRLWGRWFPISPEAFDILNFAGISFYKLLILIFLLVPGILLLLLG
ncbi:MAG: hypothetical protein U0800_13450 [Isosphaeraceae bacterium]